MYISIYLYIYIYIYIYIYFTEMHDKSDVIFYTTHMHVDITMI